MPSAASNGCHIVKQDTSGKRMPLGVGGRVLGREEIKIGRSYRESRSVFFTTGGGAQERNGITGNGERGRN